MRTPALTAHAEAGDQRGAPAGSNRMELLLFQAGGGEVYGINVFKVREVCEYRAVTAMPNSAAGLEGILSLRGSIVPVINLAACLGLPASAAGGKLIVTEFTSGTQALHVDAVDRIVRVAWDAVRAPRGVMAAGAAVTAITRLEDDTLVSILDVEQIVAGVLGEEEGPELAALDPGRALPVFFADDSPLARKRIAQVLDQLGVPHQHAANGVEAWQRLDALAAQSPVPLHTRLGLVLVDAEMPEMDGYVLTRRIKGDRRFDRVPVLMHSSLSSIANRKLGQQVGVDAYVAKFHFEELANAITAMLEHRKEAA